MTAFRAVYADWKLVKTRQVVQVVFEVPLHDADAAYEVLGGMPAPAAERWFGIAALAPERPQPVVDRPPAGAKRAWRDLPATQQAAMRVSNEPAFAAYLRENHQDEWHETGDADSCLKLICRIESKKELMTNHKALVLWRQIDSQYEAWKALEHA